MKARGQNFVIDGNTVRRIVRAARVGPSDVVVEVGPGLGSLTLGLLPEVSRVIAVEVDEALAAALPATVAEFAPGFAERLDVVAADAMRVNGERDQTIRSERGSGGSGERERNQTNRLPGPPPTALVANLPYNVAVPVLLHMLETFATLRRVLVMVQKEVADRLAAGPGSRTYGVPSVKAAWYASVRPAGSVGRNVFWPAPNVDSGLVAMDRRDPPAGADREAVFAVIDAAFAQRRKTLRAALSGWAGSAAGAEAALRAAGIDPRTRGEQLTIDDYVRIAGRGGSV
jgi:16S rRNA (adenine1518-N6/adenine1519-N6)-dimethyltransferase